MLRTILATIVFVGLAALSGCALRLAPLAQDDMQPASGAPVAPGTSKGPHLYVADNGTIYKFALVNGLPNTTPESVFASGTGAQFLGVDAKNRIYAAGADGYDGLGFIERFSADGTLEGSAKLNVYLYSFAVDSEGYTYVAPGHGMDVAYTYAPNVFDESSAQPIATLTAHGAYQFQRMAVGGAGHLYTAAYFNVNVFDTPHKSASAPSTTFPAPSGYWDPVFDRALAFDEHNRFYGSLDYLSYCNRRCSRTKYKWLYTDFDNVLHPFQSNREHRIIYGRGCRTRTSAPNGWIPGTVNGMAVYGGYIDAACSGNKTGVWVFSANGFKDQNPIEQLSGLVDPTDAKIGP